MNKYTLEQFKKFSAEIEAFERGEEIEFKGEPYHWWILASNPTFDLHLEYRVKPKLTIEENTAQFIKDNDLKIGDKVKITKGSFKGHIFEVDFISIVSITGIVNGSKFCFPVECLEKVTEEWISFDFSDAPNIIGNIVIHKDTGSYNIITNVNLENVSVSRITISYNELLKEFCFLDSTPCGKLK